MPSAIEDVRSINRNEKETNKYCACVCCDCEAFLTYSFRFFQVLPSVRRLGQLDLNDLHDHLHSINFPGQLVSGQNGKNASSLQPQKNRDKTRWVHSLYFHTIFCWTVSERPTSNENASTKSSSMRLSIATKTRHSGLLSPSLPLGRLSLLIRFNSPVNASAVMSVILLNVDSEITVD